MAAGPWYTSSGVGDLNIALAPAIIEAKLTSATKNREVFGHPVVQTMLAQDEALGELLGALGVQVGFVDVNEAVMADRAEGLAAAPTNFDTSSASLTPARKSHSRKISDMAQSIQEQLLRGEIGPTAYAMLVNDGMNAWINAIIDLMGDLASGATNEIGTTGTALTWASLQEGIYDVKDRGVSGRGLAVLTNKGAKDLADDGLSLGGAVQMSQTIQQLIPDAATGSYLGTYFGCDFHMLDATRLDTAGGDTLGSLWFPGGVHSKHQRVPLPPAATPAADLGWLTIEAIRGDGGTTVYESVAHCAVGVREQGRMAAIRYVTV